MTIELALRLTECLLGLALMQSSLEHIGLNRPGEGLLFLPRFLLAIALAAGILPGWIPLALLIHALWVLIRFDGPYNGGSDRMALLMLACLAAARLWPTMAGQELAFAYLALQLMLSYLIAGWVKIVNPEWRSGRALRDVFQFSVYPVSKDLRRLAEWPRLMFAASWMVMLFELAFPLSLLNPLALAMALGLAAMFHLSNALFLGLNRFFWTWIAAFPSILWLQQRLLV
ncbi:MAG: HTTM domain-containing protein [Pseudomonadota bacterium]